MGCKNKNILITGISGFVGSLLARELIDRSANVYGLVRRRSDGQIPYNIKRQKIEKGINLIEGDLELSLIHILRAHETPEHLVCRLLLEKKKNNTTRFST